jgi:hypothetical protein
MAHTCSRIIFHQLIFFGENSQGDLAEQFWRGNWQPVHTATIINTVQSYKMRNGNLSFSAWLRYASE